PECKDRIIKHSFFAAMLLLLMSLSVACSAGSLTRTFVFELKQNPDSLKQRVSIKRDWHTLSGNQSNIAHINDYEGPDLVLDKKRHRPLGYCVEKNIIVSMSWQWLYATNLLIVCELILTTEARLSVTPYFWLPAEVVVTVGWLLKNHCNPNTRLFNPIEQQANQGHPLATIITVFGSGNNPPQYPSSESSSQQAPQAATHPPVSSFISLLNNDCSGGNGGGHQQHLHTLGLNCFAYPCHGFCRFRPSSNSTEPTEWPLNSLKSSCPHLAAGHCLSCMGHFGSENVMGSRQNLIDSIRNAIEIAGLLNDDEPMLRHLSSIADDFVVINGSFDLQSLPEEDGTAFTLNDSETQQTSSESFQLDQRQSQLSQTSAAKAEADSGQKNCEVTVVGKDGQSRPCGKLCKHARALVNHKRRYHTGQKTCDVTVVGEDCQQQPCGKLCENAQSLLAHKSKCHGKQQTCEVILVGEDGQQRPCGKLCKNSKTLSYHRRQEHSGQQVCDVIVVGKDGLQRPCGKVCKSASSLTTHKSGYHTREKTCDVILIGADGQQRPCGKLCKNAKALSDHKSKSHSGQQACEVIVVEEDGQQRPCGKFCKNVGALSSHKSKYHSGEKNCDEIIVGKDGQKLPCGRVCKNAQALLDHKRRHRKRKPADSITDSCMKSR
ncbi:MULTISPECIES: hypothetical protein, partial [unclassified Endozoicomonas]|uniref:hypothetical protein n=2 Tax=Endozoicomonas TaxID=305899 RepID=UPI0021496194